MKLSSCGDAYFLQDRKQSILKYSDIKENAKEERKIKNIVKFGIDIDKPIEENKQNNSDVLKNRKNNKQQIELDLSNKDYNNEINTNLHINTKSAPSTPTNKPEILLSDIEDDYGIIIAYLVIKNPIKNNIKE